MFTTDCSPLKYVKKLLTPIAGNITYINLIMFRFSTQIMFPIHDSLLNFTVGLNLALS